jgi:hypothetical protein
VDIQLLSDGSPLVTWIEFADNRAQFMVRGVLSSGKKGTAMAV